MSLNEVVDVMNMNVGEPAHLVFISDWNVVVEYDMYEPIRVEVPNAAK